MKNVRSGGNIFKGASGAADDEALFNLQTTLVELALQVEIGNAKLFFCIFFDRAENIQGVLIEVFNGVGIAGMEGQGDHRPYGAKIQVDGAVVVADFAWV